MGSGGDIKPSRIRITIEATNGYSIRQARGKWIELPSNDKVSYHADNAGGAHGKDTNDK